MPKSETGDRQDAGPKHLVLRAETLMAEGEACHFCRTVLTPHRPRALHGHDFYELAWLQNGRAVHHMEGRRHALGEGDMVFIRPHDRHGWQGKGDDAVLVNVAFRTELIAGIGQRLGLAGRHFWAEAPAPETVHLGIRALTALSGRALRLEASGRRPLSAEAFLLPLLDELEAGAPDNAAAVPQWLAEACRSAREPEVFREGAAGLARAAGRSHPHVSRAMRQHLGLSPSDYVNRCRMDHAARLLAGGDDGLADIAAETGLRNLSHFHRLFRARFGMSPLEYRRTHQKHVVQPV